MGIEPFVLGPDKHVMEERQAQDGIGFPVVMEKFLALRSQTSSQHPKDPEE
jgi:hypothetical protein